MKNSSDGRVMLNIGCRTRTHADWNNLDFSPIIFLVHYPLIADALFKSGLLSSIRYDRIKKTDPQIVSYNLRKGIPFQDNTFDAIYHSHFLEHLDQDAAINILKECYRCLKAEGILRVVIPDLYLLAARYLSTYHQITNNSPLPQSLTEHKESTYQLLHQMIPKEPAGTSLQKPLVRFFERMLRGNSEKAGELHRWMYDQYTLSDLLNRLGFREIQVQGYSSSRIMDWESFCLDCNDDGTPYIAHSLYIEAIK
jgi:ubiquinone/menaquinone biosynthesis C-methylase UbiE